MKNSYFKKMTRISGVLFLFVLTSSLKAQNVGISSASFTPNYLLHLNHTAASGAVFQISNTTSGTLSTDGLIIRDDAAAGFNLEFVNQENGTLSFYTNGLQKLIIGDSGLLLNRPINYGYLNFNTTAGYFGYGFRSWNGVMQYKNLGGSWTNFPAMPAIPGNVEWWIRPPAAMYIQPIYNPDARVYDQGQMYGFYYSGANNLIGGYFRTTNATPGACAVQGFSDVTGNQTYGYLGYNNSITVGATTIGGSAVFGEVNDPNRTAVYAKTSGASDVAAALAYSSVWIASYDWTENTSATYNPSAIYGQLNISGTVGGIHTAIKGYNNRTIATNPGYTVGLEGISNANSEDGFAVRGAYIGAGTVRTGAYFIAQNATNNYLYVADNTNNRKATGNGGAVSEVIPTEKHGRVMLTTPECPEYWYFDYGSIQLIDGKAHVDLDPILADIIVVDEQNPLKVFCQVNIPNSNGVAIINKTATGFDIVEINGGTNSGEIDYQIVARPKTNYGEGRFPQGPGPLPLKPWQEPKQAMAKNSGNRDKAYRWPNDWDVYKYNVEDVTAVGDVIIDGPHKGMIKLGGGKYSNSIPMDKKSMNIK